MNYRHAYHAGNFADVLKHAALIAALAHLKKKDTSFAIIDTHGGRGIYELGGAEAEKTGEAKEGIVRLLGEAALPGVLAPYAELVRAAGEDEYPGSPLITAKLLRAKDRLFAVEKHPEEFAVLASVLAPYPRARAIEGDGYAELKKLLPPPERRGLVLIDPPFEDASEFQKASRALIEAHRRFATGIYLFWYPAKEKAAVAAAEGEIMNAGMQRLLKVELEVGSTGEATLPGRGPKLSSAGLLIVNPPYGFAEEMLAILPYLAVKLAQGPEAGFTCETLGNRE